MTRTQYRSDAAERCAVAYVVCALMALLAAAHGVWALAFMMTGMSVVFTLGGIAALRGWEL